MDHIECIKSISPVIGVYDVISHIDEGAVITQNSSAQNVTVPDMARVVRVSAKDGETWLSINRAASSSSYIHIPESSVDYFPIRGDLIEYISFYGIAGTVYVAFLG